MTDNEPSLPSTLPFASYPSNGRALIGRVRGGNCRNEYGLRHQQLTGQTTCGYCGLASAEQYEYWLMMALDHVIPASVCITTGIQSEWVDDHANRILCCSACNGFKNRWKPEVPPILPLTLDAFFDLRDSIFIERKRHILKSQAEERSFFESKPWLNKPDVKLNTRGQKPAVLRQAELNQNLNLKDYGDAICVPDDDAAYYSWLEANPAGFVINCYRNLDPKSFVLHSAKCRHIAGQTNRTYTLGTYLKACSILEADLQAWAFEHGGAARLCQSCRL